MRKTLLINKVPAEKLGVLAVSQIHLLKLEVRSREEKMGGAVFVNTGAPSRIPVMISVSEEELWA